MRLYHITSPNCALKIIDSGRFIPASRHPLNNDNGLNCFAFVPGFQMGQKFEQEGARIIFEWSGPIALTRLDTSPPLPPSVLHNQHPWRCFVRAVPPNGQLRAIAIRFDKGVFDAMLDRPWWYCLLTRSQQEALCRSKKLVLLQGIRSRYRNKNLPIEVSD